MSELSSDVRSLIETEFDDIWVEGELSGFKRHRSGHCYFTLKDDAAQIRCVIWRHFTRYIFFEPGDGMLVRVHGQMSLYEARGDVQLVARSMQLAGEGALQAAFDALKARLASEGLFDSQRKRELPRLPLRIGVVTSASGAVLHDITTILSRRFPAIELIVCPVAVQGLGAASEIAAAIRRLNLEHQTGNEIDVLIVGRGGGSIEDLWAFNEEIVARAIAGSSIPVISAVGHETDYTIADFVADIRAATPSMAAELVVPDRRDLDAGLRSAVRRMTDCLSSTIENHRRSVSATLTSRAIHRPVDRLRQTGLRVDDLSQRIEKHSQRCVNAMRQKTEGLSQRLALLDPNRPLNLGYARVERDGDLVTSADELKVNDRIRLVFKDATRDALIED